MVSVTLLCRCKSEEDLPVPSLFHYYLRVCEDGAEFFALYCRSDVNSIGELKKPVSSKSLIQMLKNEGADIRLSQTKIIEWNGNFLAHQVNFPPLVIITWLLIIQGDVRKLKNCLTKAEDRDFPAILTNPVKRPFVMGKKNSELTKCFL